MPSVAVKVKWLKNKYDVEIDLDEPAELFKTQVRFWGEEYAGVSDADWAIAKACLLGMLPSHLLGSADPAWLRRSMRAD